MFGNSARLVSAAKGESFGGRQRCGQLRPVHLAGTANLACRCLHHRVARGSGQSQSRGGAGAASHAGPGSRPGGEFQPRVSRGMRGPSALPLGSTGP